MSLQSRTRTKSQRVRCDAIHEQQCLACLVLESIHGREFCCGWITEQHTKGRMRKDSHDKTYALGSWHHLGIPHDGWTRHSMETEYGPSLQRGTKPFHAAFGSNSAFVVLQNHLLENGEPWK